MQFERQQRRARAVNLTPLIDVVFLLIVFFMLSTSFVMSESLELSLPSGKAAPIDSKEVMQMLVRQDGTILHDSQSYTLEELDALLMSMLGSNPDQKILLLSGRDVNVQQLVSVMDLVYLNGGRNVQIDQDNF